MSKIIITAEIDSDDFAEFIEGMGDSYDENCLYEPINAMLDDLPVCVFLRGYNIEDD